MQPPKTLHPTNGMIAMTMVAEWIPAYAGMTIEAPTPTSLD